MLSHRGGDLRLVGSTLFLTGILHDIWALSVFHEKLSPGIAKAVTMLGPTSKWEEGVVAISHF